VSATRPVILDTDIGSDVDDCLALGVILGSPELELAAVTCVYGDVGLRARMVRKLLRLRGTEGVAVFTGARDTLLKRDAVWWAGHEGEGLLGPDDVGLEPDGGDAAGEIARVVRERPGEVHLVAIGPLTNVALALLRDPGLAGALGGLTVMGGCVRGPDRLELPVAEHNIKCDPDAARVVFESGVRVDLIPLDVTTRVAIRKQDVERLHSGGTAYHEAVAGQVERYPRFARQGSTFLHDPLAVATLVAPGLVRSVEAHVTVELDGEFTRGMTVVRKPTEDLPANARVALDVDVEAAEALVIERLTR